MEQSGKNPPYIYSAEQRRRSLHLSDTSKVSGEESRKPASGGSSPSRLRDSAIPEEGQGSLGRYSTLSSLHCS